MVEPTKKQIKRFKPQKSFKCRRCSDIVGAGNRKTVGYKVNSDVYCRLCFIWKEGNRGSQGLNNGLSAGRIYSWGRGCR